LKGALRGVQIESPQAQKKKSIRPVKGDMKNSGRSGVPWATVNGATEKAGKTQNNLRAFGTVRKIVSICRAMKKQKETKTWKRMPLKDELQRGGFSQRKKGWW